MAKIVMAGGGLGGLAASIFLARRGHDVTVIERDGPPPGPGTNPDEDAAGWRRPGAPQAQQSHVLLARARRVLLDETPDIHEALLRQGVREHPVVVGLGRLEGEAMLATRRLVTEGVLRRAAQREPGVTFLAGDAVAGLQVGRRPGNVPVVTGVRTKSGGVIDAELVVDAGGRRSALPGWLIEAGCRPAVEETQPLGFFYLTRYYRRRPGCELPEMRLPNSTALDYGRVMAFGGDNDTFSLTLALSVTDPHRTALRDPAIHSRFLRAVPLTAPWIEGGEPIGDIAMMARIENRRRRLVDDDGPIVGGIVALGDAALHTNPTLGRGTSMAFWQAQHLAGAADTATDDPAGFVGAFDSWLQDHQAVWFDTQVSIDAANRERMEAGVRGERLPPPNNPATRFAAGAMICAQTDAVVGRAVAEMVHLLAPPAEAFGRPEVAERVMAFLASDPDLSAPPSEPSRAEFERIATTAL